jgi:hypothetical protein
MKAVMPYVEVPGDNEEIINNWLRPRIMGRGGTCMGMTNNLAVWRFGAMPGSEFATAYGVSLPEHNGGFLWVLATRKTGKIRETFNGYAIELPTKFRNVIDFESSGR